MGDKASKDDVAQETAQNQQEVENKDETSSLCPAAVPDQIPIGADGDDKLDPDIAQRLKSAESVQALGAWKPQSNVAKQPTLLEMMNVTQGSETKQCGAKPNIINVLHQTSVFREETSCPPQASVQECKGVSPNISAQSVSESPEDHNKEDQLQSTQKQREGESSACRIPTTFSQTTNAELAN